MAEAWPQTTFMMEPINESEILAQKIWLNTFIRICNKPTYNIRAYDAGLRTIAVADLGFPVGGRAPVRGGHGPLTWALFGENVCKNERIGSHRGRAPGTPPRSANVLKM